MQAKEQIVEHTTTTSMQSPRSGKIHPMNEKEQAVLNRALKSRYFQLLKKEKLEKTPKITEELDILERMIKFGEQKKPET